MDKKFLLNTRRKTVHSLEHIRDGCKISSINKENIESFYTEEEVRAYLGVNISCMKECKHCMPTYRIMMNREK